MNKILKRLTEIAMPMFLGTFAACAADVADASNERGERADGAQLSADASLNPYEWDTAVAGTPPQDFSGGCVTMTGAKACFEKNGDKWWVLDTVGDGHSATASWENWLYDGVEWVVWRSGSCVNKLGKGNWGVCNKEYYENSTINVYGFAGSEVFWEACIYDSANGTWHGCSEGGRVAVNDE